MGLKDTERESVTSGRIARRLPVICKSSDFTAQARSNSGDLRASGRVPSEIIYLPITLGICKFPYLEFSFLKFIKPFWRETELAFS